jgi:FKBP-type peptidyl-prolyl cis-trans isomerase
MIKNICSLSLTLFLVIFFTSVQKINAQTQVHATSLKTKSGLVYKIVPGKGGEKPKAGEFIKFRFRYTIGAKDSVLQSTYERLPAYSPVDTGKKVQYSFMEVIPKMSVGDSAAMIISVDSLVKKKIIAAYNPTFQKGSAIKCGLRLLQVFKSDSAVSADYAKETELEKEREIQAIESYMAQTGVTGGIRTKNGVYVSIENPGDTTLKADTGKLASIKYKGYLLSGKVFDTNMDSSRGHTDPIEVTVGKRQVIPGWEEALPYFGKGGKGKIFIPAMLGYGPQAMGADIPAFSDLIFDIEILDVKQAP